MLFVLLSPANYRAQFMFPVRNRLYMSMLGASGLRRGNELPN